MNTSKNSEPPARQVWLIGASFATALVLAQKAYPPLMRQFLPETWYASVWTVGIVCALALISVLAFLECPMRRWILKNLALLAMSAAVFLAAQGVGLHMHMGAQ